MPPEVDPPAAPSHLDGGLRLLEHADHGELVRLRETARVMVEDEGVVVGSDASGEPQHLAVDPVPLVLTSRTWSAVERGLAQRAVLLDLLLDDIQTERSLVSRGLLPPQLVVGHPGFVPQAGGVPTRHGVVMTAADLGQDVGGSWCVVADRTQVPVGAGYAMAIRRITARTLASLHRATELRRLRDFFDAMRAGLQETAAQRSSSPRVVVLTSSAPEESAFDEFFTATLLGFPVVQADDLEMRGGRVWLHTTEQPEPVDVIVRRIAGGQVDPLDVGPSEVGIPGLVEASRSGTVTVVNPIGAGVLENPALAAFLPAIARALMGEDLLLPPVRTWWCGREDDHRHVRDHLGELLVSPISPTAGNPRILVSELSAEGRSALCARIEAQPWAWCAQEVLPKWTAPVVTDTGLATRPGLLRTFTFADARGTTVMPGGLARLAAGDGDTRVPSLRDAVVKDVWVLADGSAPTSREEPWSPAREAEATPGRPSRRLTAVPLPPAAAEDLYWFGRYAERGESTARLLLVTDDLVADNMGRPGTAGYEAMRILVNAVDSLTAVQRDRTLPRDVVPTTNGGLPADVLPHLRTLVFDGVRRGTLRYSAHRAATAAARVREVLSADTWLVLSRLDRILGSAPPPGEQLQSVLAMVIESYLALAGIGAEGLVRDASWAFLDAGRRVERSQETLRLLRHTVISRRSRRVDGLVLEAVLGASESLISHRRRTAGARTGQGPLELALELLLTDPGNPRSVTFQLDMLREDMTHAPSATVDGAIGVPERQLVSADVPRLASDPGLLEAFLLEAEGGIRDVSDALDATVFRHRVRHQVVEGRP